MRKILFPLVLLAAAPGCSPESSEETTAEAAHQDHASHASAPALAPDADGLGLGGLRVAPPLGGRDVTAGFFDIVSDSDDQLVGVSGEGVDVIELHTHEEKDGMMSMRKVPHVDLPAGEIVSFQPKGLHLMIFGVPELQSGDEIAISLKFASGRERTVSFPVKAADEAHSHNH